MEESSVYRTSTYTKEVHTAAISSIHSRTDLKDEYRQRDRDLKTYQTWLINHFRDCTSFRFLKQPTQWKNSSIYLGSSPPNFQNAEVDRVWISVQLNLFVYPAPSHICRFCCSVLHVIEEYKEVTVATCIPQLNCYYSTKPLSLISQMLPCQKTHTKFQSKDVCNLNESHSVLSLEILWNRSD